MSTKVYLFQGDSITDVGRERVEETHSLGHGYATVISAILSNKYRGKFKFYNRGIGGNRIVDVYARIKMDILNLKPDYMSILIGVNDVWHEFGDKNGVDADKFENIYSMLIEEIKAEFPNIKIFILEPFVTGGPVLDEFGSSFKEEVMKRAQKAKAVAEKYNLTFIPLQEEFDKAAQEVDDAYVTIEGVHPTIAGHGLIAAEVLKVIEDVIAT